MIRRRKKRKLPDPVSPPLFAVDVEDRGEHIFCSMDPVTAAEFFAEMADSGVTALTADDGAGAVYAMTARQWRVGGAAIGVCWHHQTIDLESSPADHGSFMSLGGAVIKELHAEGYSIEQQSQLLSGVVKQMGGVRVTAKEVESRVDFSAAPAGAVS
jgi:hypothetical protein